MGIEAIRKRNNFRELGGYRTQDGRTVKHGMFYRCGALGELNEEELEIVKSLGLYAVYDFRSAMEVNALPDPIWDGVEYFHLSAMKDMSGGNPQNPNKEKAENLSPAAMEEAMLSMMLNSEGEKMFREHVYGDLGFTKAYQVMFEELKQGHAPIAFHCTAGKDRTGIAAILILLALGVDYETAMQDYMLTCEYRREQMDTLKEKAKNILAEHPELEDKLQAFEGVRRENAEYTFQRILERCGTLEEYFRTQFGLGPEELEEFRNMYTER